jgi:hypothetical protein
MCFKSELLRNLDFAVSKKNLLLKRLPKRFLDIEIIIFISFIVVYVCYCIGSLTILILLCINKY